MYDCGFVSPVTNVIDSMRGGPTPSSQWQMLRILQSPYLSIISGHFSFQYGRAPPLSFPLVIALAPSMSIYRSPTCSLIRYTFPSLDSRLAMFATHSNSFDTCTYIDSVLVVVDDLCTN